MGNRVRVDCGSGGVGGRRDLGEGKIWTTVIGQKQKQKRTTFRNQMFKERRLWKVAYDI